MSEHARNKPFAWPPVKAVARVTQTRHPNAMIDTAHALINELENSNTPERVLSALLLLICVDQEALAPIETAARDPGRSASQRQALGRLLDAAGAVA
jgi:hypothetical protein